jgi:hypothetical protein
LRNRRTLIVGLTSLLYFAPAANASHAWESFHWSRAANPLRLEVVDSVVGEWDALLTASVADWDRSTVLALSSSSGADSLVDRILCRPIGGKIRVCNAHYPDPTWLGLATVWLKGGHVAQATAQVNDTWFDTVYADANAKRHVLCQEIGHGFGLDHTYTEPTCMDDTGGLSDPAYVSPGPHDYHQLEAVYAHLDGAGGAKARKNRGRAPRGQDVCPANACRSMVRVWKDGPFTVVQYVLLPGVRVI